MIKNGHLKEILVKFILRHLEYLLSIFEVIADSSLGPHQPLIYISSKYRKVKKRILA